MGAFIVSIATATLDGVQCLSETKMMAKAAKILFEYGGLDLGTKRPET